MAYEIYQSRFTGDKIDEYLGKVPSIEENIVDLNKDIQDLDKATKEEFENYSTTEEVSQMIDDAKYVLPVADNDNIGGVKPDGTSITIDEDGTIHGASNIEKLEDIGDVDILDPEDDEVLAYYDGKWVNKIIQGGEINCAGPVGTIISFMGISAPDGYLVCDGKIYNIDDYKELAKFIKTQFGTYNKFGGNGTTTFAVPDLRGEFLRGTGTNSHASQGNGMPVGTHQDATEHLQIFYNASNYYMGVFNAPSAFSQSVKTDSEKSVNSTSTGRQAAVSSNWKSDNRANFFTSRPTNTSVLYCIKYTTITEQSVAAMSCDIYDEKETIIGCWKDGRPIYRRQFDGKFGVTTTGTIYESIIYTGTEINDTINIIKMYGSDTNQPLNGIVSISNEIPWYTRCLCSKPRNSILVYHNFEAFNNKPVSIIIEYTKTTDAENSFRPEMITTFAISNEVEDEQIKVAIDILKEA